MREAIKPKKHKESGTRGKKKKRERGTSMARKHLTIKKSNIKKLWPRGEKKLEKRRTSWGTTKEERKRKTGRHGPRPGADNH